MSNVSTHILRLYLDWHVQLARETISFWSKGFSEETSKKLENFGFIQLRPGGEHSDLCWIY
jgi:hypothetical protein